jgi:glutamate-1-semialdehyde 2,1-aminomutase
LDTQKSRSKGEHEVNQQTHARSEQLFDKAQHYISGGVNSPSRSFAAVGGGSPVFIERGEGAYLYSVDGHRYIDYLCAFGALILGHAHPAILSAVSQAIRRGTVYGAPTELEVEFAAKLCEIVPTLEMVRFNVSGTEAVMTAIRLARAATSRSKILKFSGSYHGHSDLVLVSAGSGSSTLDIDDSLGVPLSVKQEVVDVPFNNPEALRQAVALYGDELAAALVEPVVGNFGIVPPEPGFLELLEQLMHSCGALVIWDEVITAFRFTYGSIQDLFGLRPDIITLGKIIGGGLPIGAYGARREIMEYVAPVGGVYQDGTMAGNPLSMLAGMTCLELLKEPGLYDRLTQHGRTLADAARAASKKYGIATHVGHFGGAVSVQFTDERVIDFEGCNRSSSAMFTRFFRLMLEQGIFIPPSKYEAMFVSAAHSQDDIDYTAECIDRALAKIAAE